MATTTVAYDIIARDLASKAFRNVAASAKEQQVAVSKAFAEQDAAARRARASITSSLKAQESAMLKAQAATAKYGKSTAFLNSHKDMLGKVAGGLTKVGLIAGVAFGAAVKASADFNAEMARVFAFSDDARAHGEQLKKLAMTAGAAFGYSATQTAQAMEEEVKAGISATDMINGGLKGALALAAAGQIDVGQATSIAAAAMTNFGLKGKDIPHLADLLAAGADKALGGVGDLGEAMNYAGTQAHQYGLNIEDTVGTLAAFAQNGQLGSVAGTEFAEVLTRLGAPTGKAAKTMKQLHLSAYDARGDFVSMPVLAGRLQKAFERLSPAQRNAAEQTIFGQRAVRGANILIKEGASGITEWIRKVNDQGFAAQTAARKLDSLSGDLQKLKAAFSTALIGAGNGQQNVLRGAVQEITKLLDKWNSLGSGTQNTITKIVGGVAAIALAGAGLIKVVTTAAKVKVALIDMGIAGKKAGTEVAAGAETGSAALGKARKAAGLAAAAIVGIQVAGQVANSIIGDYGASSDAASASVLDLANSSKSARGALSEIFKETKTSGDYFATADINGYGDALNRLFNRSTAQQVNDWITGVGEHVGLAKGQFSILKDQATEVDTALTNLATSGASKQAGDAFAKLAAQAQKQHVSMQELLTLFPQYKDALHAQAASLGVTNLSAKDYVAWMGGKIPPAILAAIAGSKQHKTATQQDTKSIKDQVQALVDQRQHLIAAGNAAITASNDQIAMKQAIKDATDAAKKNGQQTDISTQKGRDNRTALNQLASSTLAYVNDLIDQHAKTGKLVQATEEGRKAFIRVAEQMGYTKGEAQKLADKYKLLDKRDLIAKISTPGMKQAQDNVYKLSGQISGLHDKKVNIDYQVAVGGKVLPTLSFLDPQMRGHATGGPISGPGGPTSDSVPILASNGEYMQTAAAHSYYGTAGMDAINQRRIPKGLLAGFAGGGPIDRNLILQYRMPNVASTVGGYMAAAESRMNGDFVNYTKKLDFGPPVPGGSGVARWRSTIMSALGLNGLPQTLAYVNAWLRQIATESGGNPHAVQGNIGDINNITGDLAKGLLQTISATFNAYHFPGHSDIFNGFDNSLAAINYAKHRYGSTGMLGVIGHGHGYDNGGVLEPGVTAAVNASGKPEAVLTHDQWGVLRELASGGGRNVYILIEDGDVSDARVRKLRRAFDDYDRKRGPVKQARRAG